MKIGIEQGAYLNRYGFVQGLARMKKHGYECLDYQDFIDTETELFQLPEAEFEKRLLTQKQMITEAGIEISQTHGPWRWPPQDTTQAEREERFEKMAKSVRGTAILGCTHFVIHPIMPYGAASDPEPERMWAMNQAFMSRLVEVGATYGVEIDFENMPMTALAISRPEAILRFVKELHSPFFKVCLDTGHCAVFGDSPAEAVRLIGKEYLAVLHVHDNNGQGDFHWIPYTGVVDWEDFSAALEEIGFEGTVSLETSVPGKIPEDIREVHEIGLFQMAKKIARR